MDAGARRRKTVRPTRIYFVVDGLSDEAFWTKQIQEHFGHVLMTSQNLNGNEPAHDFLSIMTHARKYGADYVLFLTDEDAEPDPEKKRKDLERELNILRKKEPRWAERVRIFGVKRGLEAWLLADDVAVKKVFPKSNISHSRKTDYIADCKNEVRHKVYTPQFGRGFSFNVMHFAKRMACSVDFDRASKNSDSLALFWKRMRDVFIPK